VIPTDLAAFLLARIAEDEQIARAASHERRWIHIIEGYTDRVEREFEEGVICSAQSAEFASHIANWDPARVLIECEAKRRMIDPYVRTVAAMDQVVRDDELEYAIVRTGAESFTFVAKLIGLAYAHHPEYHEEWRP
jgi:hypothetical protein